MLSTTFVHQLHVRNSMKFTPSYFVIVVVVVVGFIATTSIEICNAEHYISIDSLQKLNDIEMSLFKSLRQYVEWEEMELANYHKFLAHTKLQHELAHEDIDEYLENPINIFLLIKRIFVDWEHLHKNLKTNLPTEMLSKQLQALKSKFTLPDATELHGVVKGFARLQNVYNLQVKDLVGVGDDVAVAANGLFGNVTLDVSECFTVAVHLHTENMWQLAIEWFNATLEKMHEEQDVIKMKAFRTESLEYLALSYFKLGNYVEALNQLNVLLAENPKHSARAIKSYIFSQSLMPLKSKNQKALENQTNANYTRLCQGVRVPNRMQHKLKCKLVTKKSSIFRLLPLKMEQISLSPVVTMYHNFLTQKHIENILGKINKTHENFLTFSTNDALAIEGRVSQQMSLHENLLLRLSDITNFNYSKIALAQIESYGVGGAYATHHDALEQNSSDIKCGKRKSTFMFYLTDVAAGGYKVFPKLNIFIPPEKGALVVWHNLNKSLDVDNRMLHADCPVIKGAKIVGNIWLNADFPEFQHPCALTA